ncbi:hypothetical protein J1614_010900 [Plenodomus biglobosus]|nr:hypothetical protein J1614_010900 [Plenodomus biglobosus]
MSSARFMRHVTVAGKQVNIYIAQEIRQAGIRRSIDAIDPAILRDTVNKGCDGFGGRQIALDSSAGSNAGCYDYVRTLSKLHGYPVDKNRSMPHESAADENNHSTIEIRNANGAPVAKAHVTTDPRKQQVSSSFWSAISRTWAN